MTLVVNIQDLRQNRKTKSLKNTPLNKQKYKLPSLLGKTNEK